MDSISRSFSLLKQSWAVLRANMTLAIFPILSGLACIMVMVSFLAPVIAIPGLRDMFTQGNRRGDPAAQVVFWVGLFCFYLVNYFIIVFFNVALVSCAIMHFNGRKPTFTDGLRAAMSRMPQILGWATMAATVGIILKAIDDRSDWLGQFAVHLLGLAWSAVTYLVVPILAVEKLGPIDAVKRSATLLKQCWGEGLVGNFSLGLIAFVAYIPGFVIIFAAVALGGMAGPANLPILIAGIGLGVLYMLGVAIILSTLKQIYVAGLYIYAAEQRVPGTFSTDLMRGAFRRR